MGMPVRIDNVLYEQAKNEAKAEHRTIAGQIEFWACVGRAAIGNPELPIDFVVQALASMKEPRSVALRLLFSPVAAHKLSGSSNSQICSLIQETT